jgi:hypothetical protein
MERGDETVQPGALPMGGLNSAQPHEQRDPRSLGARTICIFTDGRRLTFVDQQLRLAAPILSHR